MSLWLPLALAVAAVAAVAAGQSPLQRRVVRDVLEYFHGRSNVHFLFKERDVDGVIERASNGTRHREPGWGHREWGGARGGNGEGDGASWGERAVGGVTEGGSRDWDLGFGVQSGHRNREGVGWVSCREQVVNGVIEHGSNRIRDWDSGPRIQDGHGNGEAVGVSQREQRGVEEGTGVSPREWEMDRIIKQVSLRFGVQDYGLGSGMDTGTGRGLGCPKGNGSAGVSQREWQCQAVCPGVSQRKWQCQGVSGCPKGNGSVGVSWGALGSALLARLSSVIH